MLVYSLVAFAGPHGHLGVKFNLSTDTDTDTDAATDTTLIQQLHTEKQELYKELEDEHANPNYNLIEDQLSCISARLDYLTSPRVPLPARLDDLYIERCYYINNLSITIGPNLSTFKTPACYEKHWHGIVTGKTLVEAERKVAEAYEKHVVSSVESVQRELSEFSWNTIYEINVQQHKYGIMIALRHGYYREETWYIILYHEPDWYEYRYNAYVSYNGNSALLNSAH